jgi:C-terminal processing protease CtpA/Prc
MYTLVLTHDDAGLCLEAPKSGWVFVKKIMPGGVAERDGSITRGDRLLAVSLPVPCQPLITLCTMS